jgi:mersacidin/lichenicidin family type 2 lantibiotic
MQQVSKATTVVNYLLNSRINGTRLLLLSLGERVATTTFMKKEQRKEQIAMNFDIVRAWKDEAYRSSLSAQERAMLPENPAGVLELNEAELQAVYGAANINGNVSGGCTADQQWGAAANAAWLWGGDLGDQKTNANSCVQ